MQKFVVKKSKSAPLAVPASAMAVAAATTATTSSPLSLPPATTSGTSSSSQPLSQFKPTIMECNTGKSAVPVNSTTATPNTTESFAVHKADVTSNGKTIAMASQRVTPALQSSQHSTVSHVKMSGYLKKKRNKMGGWRKLWFVLQNQLLLSYSSKEDYEKKLAPFKDVLNLMPGTTVRPTKGPRFTIETSTNLIYTYRCDNNKECSEWITALVESLGLQSTDHKHASTKLHYSMENLSKIQASSSSASSSTTSSSTTARGVVVVGSQSISPASSFMSSRSCDSIYSLQKAKINPKLPNATAKLLDRSPNKKPQQQQQSARNLVAAVGSSSAATSKKEIMTHHQVQNFRLHPTDTHGNQSFEVHQINRMFSTSSIAAANTTNSIVSEKTTKPTKTANSCANGKIIGNSPRKLAQSEHTTRHHHHHHHHQQQQSAHHHHHHHRRSSKEAHKMPRDNHHHQSACIIDSAADDNNGLFDVNSNRHSITMMESSEPTHQHRYNNNNASSDSVGDGIGNRTPLLEQIQRISLENDKNSNLHVSCVRKTSATSSSPSLSCSSSLSSGSASGVSNASTASASKFQLLGFAREQSDGHDTMATTTINAAAAAAAASPNPLTNTVSNFNNLIQKQSIGEPIYAVINLKDKYEHRAKKKSLNELQIVTVDCMQRRPNSFHVVSTDYEEVLELANEDCVDGFDDDENIYEPINIPELSTRGPLWRYFSKINIDSLVDIARWKREHQQQHSHPNGKDDSASNTTTFADLRKRFGQHRKSIKNRMRKLYNRSNSCEMHEVHGKQMSLNGNGIEINAHHRDSSGSGGSAASRNRDTSGTSTSTSVNSMDKVSMGNDPTKNEGLSAYFNKRDRHLFSSMLKKSRTSLTFDDVARKKIINLAAIGGRTITKNKPTEHLNKNGCHSKFYD